MCYWKNDIGVPEADLMDIYSTRNSFSDIEISPWKYIKLLYFAVDSGDDVDEDDEGSGETHQRGGGPIPVPLQQGRFWAR